MAERTPRERSVKLLQAPRLSVAATAPASSQRRLSWENSGMGKGREGKRYDRAIVAAAPAGASRREGSRSDHGQHRRTQEHRPQGHVAAPQDPRDLPERRAAAHDGG